MRASRKRKRQDDQAKDKRRRLAKIQLQMPSDALPSPVLAAWASNESWFLGRNAFKQLSNGLATEIQSLDYLGRVNYVNDLLSNWESSGIAPVAVVACASLLNVCAQYAGLRHQAGGYQLTRPQMSLLRLSAGSAILRFVNAIADHARKGKAKASMASSLAISAERSGIPRYLVDLRHQAAHGSLPSWTSLAEGLQQALRWVEQKYWMRQENSFRSSRARREQLVSLALNGLIRRSNRLQARLIEAGLASTHTDSARCTRAPQPWWASSRTAPILLTGSVLKTQSEGNAHAAWSPDDSARLAASQAGAPPTTAAAGRASAGRNPSQYLHVPPIVDPSAGQWACWYTAWARSHARPKPTSSSSSSFRIPLGDIEKGGAVVAQVRTLCTVCKGRPTLVAEQVVPVLLGISRDNGPLGSGMQPESLECQTSFESSQGRAPEPTGASDDESHKASAASRAADEWCSYFYSGCTSNLMDAARSFGVKVGWLLALAKYSDAAVLPTSPHDAFVAHATAELLKGLSDSAPLLGIRPVAAPAESSGTGLRPVLSSVELDSADTSEFIAWQRWMPVLVCIQRVEPSLWSSLVRTCCYTVASASAPLLQAELALRHLANSWGSLPANQVKDALVVSHCVLARLHLRVSRARRLVERLVSVESCAVFGLCPMVHPTPGGGADVTQKGQEESLTEHRQSRTASFLSEADKLVSLMERAEAQAAAQERLAEEAAASESKAAAAAAAAKQAEEQAATAQEIPGSSEGSIFSPLKKTSNPRGKGRKGKKKQPKTPKLDVKEEGSPLAKQPVNPKATLEAGPSASIPAQPVEKMPHQYETSDTPAIVHLVSRRAGTVAVPGSTALTAGGLEFSTIAGQCSAMTFLPDTSKPQDSGGAAQVQMADRGEGLASADGSDDDEDVGGDVLEPADSGSDRDSVLLEGDEDSDDDKDMGQHQVEAAISGEAGASESAVADVSDGEDDDGEDEDTDDEYSIVQSNDNDDGEGESEAAGTATTSHSSAEKLTYGAVEGCYRRDLVKPMKLPVLECARVVLQMLPRQASMGLASSSVLDDDALSLVALLEKVAQRAVPRDDLLPQLWHGPSDAIAVENARQLLETKAYHPSTGMISLSVGGASAGLVSRTASSDASASSRPAAPQTPRLSELEMLEQALAGAIPGGQVAMESGEGAAPSNEGEGQGKSSLSLSSSSSSSSSSAMQGTSPSMAPWPAHCPVIRVKQHPSQVLAAARHEAEAQLVAAGGSQDDSGGAEWGIVDPGSAAWCSPGMNAAGSNQMEDLDLLG